MILAIDVDYRSDSAVVAGVGFSSWGDEAPDRVFHSNVTDVENYESGQFLNANYPAL